MWPELARLRQHFADRIDSLDEPAWNAESWCIGWRVRDVVGHLVHLAEASQVSMLRDLARGGGRPDRALSRMATKLGAQPVPDLTRRLRAAAGGRFRIPGFPAAVTLGELAVHGADALRPLGQDWEVPPADAAAALDIYWRIARLAFHGRPRKVRLVATDISWARGAGPEVEGRATDLLLLLANRNAVLGSPSGPGVGRI